MDNPEEEETMAIVNVGYASTNSYAIAAIRACGVHTVYPGHGPSFRL